MELKYGGLSLGEYARFCTERERLIEELVGGWSALTEPPPLELLELCRKYGMNALHPVTGRFHPFIEAWESALGDDPWLLDAFGELATLSDASASELARAESIEREASSERPSHLELVGLSNGSGTYRKVV
ncbi:MAG TPA: hypothetical protein VFQ61_29720 [Polyangiaceae bacterium]|nr:hypothetical protein [Polyangiaceae bacterium]